MKYVIIEDEEEAADRLERLVNSLDTEAQVLAKLDSIESSLEWMGKNSSPDLFFMDIHLADGHSFEIFKNTEVKAPVIFTTAYDKYAIDAFKVNSIHYLLKPIKKDELHAALEKFRQLKQDKQIPAELDKLIHLIGDAKDYQKRIMVKYGQHIKVFEVENAAYFYSKDKVNYLCTTDNQKLPIDHSLDELEHMLDPNKFFRLNRQVLTSFPAIDQMFTYPKAKVKVVLKPDVGQEVLVSSERSAVFKKWLLGEK